MSRRHAAEKREVLPDAKYGDRILTKFMNNLMVDGKKSAAEKKSSTMRSSVLKASSSASRSRSSTKLSKT